ncbi:MAG: TerC family protein [Cyclobacteriaceae bacterium]|nr:TerC family protein [Cyclobacteriaceae bacterium]
MIWLLFLVLILFLLFLDLGVFHKKDKAVTMKESLLWTLVWIFISMLFGIAVYYMFDKNLYGVNHAGLAPTDAMLKYYSGYLIEKSLSLDNIFVIAIIFSYFQIEAKYQHRILFWGILGAIIFRGIMILAGTSFIEHFEWSTYIFGGILIFSAIRMMVARNDDVDYQENPLLKFMSRIYPINWDHRGHSFMIKENGKRFLTASFATLVVIEFTDVLFAVDSIPAIFAVTLNPFIVFSSNIFAILGLRSLYFFLANMMDKFRYMKFSLVFILVFVGVKMMLVNHYKLPSYVSLVFILVSLTIGILASVIFGKKDKARLKKPV